MSQIKIGDTVVLLANNKIYTVIADFENKIYKQLFGLMPKGVNEIIINSESENIIVEKSKVKLTNSRKK